MNANLTVGQCASLACLLEATIAKPGNVHRGVDFEDVTFTDFAVSSIAIAPAMQAAKEIGVGSAVLHATKETRQLVNTNTNLGLCLLLAPLAAVDETEKSLQACVVGVLQSLNKNDAADVYRAIRLANPGGLGNTNEMDVADEVPDELLSAMQAAADRDMVARQFTNDFHDVFRIAEIIESNMAAGQTLTVSVIQAHIETMAKFPDSLIARKCGENVAKQSAAKANVVLKAGAPESEGWLRAVGDLDFWLRCDGHKRNPGTTADMIGAALFVLLREGRIEPPFR